jgi:catechol 2,3-dioxygenase-like lactoylglutathione lyase family enzyme
VTVTNWRPATGDGGRREDGEAGREEVPDRVRGFALADDRLRGCLGTLTGMACRISELVIDAADPDRLAAFWSEVLGYVELGREDDGSIEIGPADAGFGGPQPTLILSPSSGPRKGKLPLHIDVNATDRDQEDELERLLALGARPADVGQTGAESWHVLADPEGNEFCLLHTRLQPL